MKVLFRRVVVLCVGDSNPRQSLRAVAWAFGVVLFLSIGGDILVYGIWYPSLSAPITAVLGKMFVVQFAASFVAAFLAPAQPVRHAIVAAFPVCLASLLGVLFYRSSESPWYYFNQALVSLLATIVAGWLCHALRALFPKHDAA